MTIIYDLKDHELPIATVDNLRLAAKWLDVDYSHLRRSAANNKLVHNRYRIINYKKNLEEKRG
jgi:hypothetical protein